MTDRARALVKKLRLFADLYGTQRGMPWIGTVRPEQAFAEAADFIEQSLTPPEGDTVSDEAVARLSEITASLEKRLMRGTDPTETFIYASQIKGIAEVATALQSSIAQKEQTVNELAERVERNDAYLIDYLLGWAGLGEPQPWGAAHSFALEVGAGYGLIRGESDSALTERGKAVAEILRASTSGANHAE